MAEQAETKLELWGILELLGHVKLAGRITEENLFGGKLGRIDMPDKDGGFVTRYFGCGSVYSMTPVSEQVARDAARRIAPEPVSEWDYPEEVRSAVRAAKMGLPKPEDDDMTAGTASPRGAWDDDERDDEDDSFDEPAF